MLILPQQLQNDIEQYAQKVQDFTNGIISETEFKVFRVPMGVYEQRKNGTYMVRVRCVAGYITPKLLQVVCDIAEKYGSKLLHITTRQEFQIQNISLENSVHIISELYQYGLTTRGGGGNTVRNIMASVDSGIAKDEIFDVFPYAVNLTNFLISQPSSWALPRKYKISFSNSSKDTGYAIFNDLGFIAKQQDSTQGFAVYVGGSLSSQPMIGELLFNFIPSSDIYTVAEAVKQVFNKYGNRRNKHKARLRFIFYKYGTEQVLNWIRTAYNELKTIETSYLFEPITLSKQTDFDKNIYTDNSDSNFILWKKRYVTQQKQKGYVSFEIPCKYGNFSPSTLRDLAKYFEPYGDDIIRFSMRQTIFVRNIPEIHIYEIYSFLKQHNFANTESKLIHSIVSCTGADTCRLGICLAKGASNAIQQKLLETPQAWDFASQLRINISGCPNSCGQHSNADIGFYGKVGKGEHMYPAYTVMLGGSIGENNSKFGLPLTTIAAKDIDFFTKEILHDFEAKQQMFSNFTEYALSEYPKHIAEKFQNEPDYKKQNDYFYDFGASSQFSLKGRGAGECSAGIFDMIDVDFTAIQKAKYNFTILQNTTEIAENAYNLAKYASRMLLVTKGYDYKGISDIFQGFIQCFINEKLISQKYLPLILEMAQANIDYAYKHQQEIIQLADDVCALYNSLDDSLQYPKIDAIANTTNATNSYHKDLRGVTCPMNFVKTKIELSKIQSGDLLEILLDDGAPIQNVPGSVRNEGHTVLAEEKVETYWKVVIKKQ